MYVTQANFICSRRGHSFDGVSVSNVIVLSFVAIKEDETNDDDDILLQGAIKRNDADELKCFIEQRIKATITSLS